MGPSIRPALARLGMAGLGLAALTLAAPAMAASGQATKAGPAAPGGRHMIPAIGARPLEVRIGAAGQTKFRCESPTAVPRCYAPGQLARAYGWDSLAHRGQGEAVVVVDAFQDPTLLDDVALEDSTFAIPAARLSIVAPQGLTPFNSGNSDMVNWGTEIALDVESVHAYAPEARIVLDLAKTDSPADLLAATKFAIDNNLGAVISMSFGLNEACVPPALLAEQHRLFDHAVAEGITLVAASGDAGASQNACGVVAPVLAVGSPAVDPNVLSVGGTNLFLDTGGHWTGETAWDDGYGMSGGGISTIYVPPPYQLGLGAPARLVPDVAYNAGVQGGVIIAFGSSSSGPGSFFDIGGTSAGSPAWAALAAVADQYAGKRLGLLNTALYQLAEGPSYPKLFHDITIGDNIIAGVGGYETLTGFDLVTGWGTPQVGNLVPALVKQLGGARR